MSAVLRAQLEDAQRIAHMGTWELDIETQKLTCSDGFYRLLGLEPARGLVDYVEGISHIHPDDLPTARGVFEDAIAQKSSYALEVRAVWPDGSIHWIHSHGHFVGHAGTARMVGTALDITERKDAEQALRASEARFRQIVETAQEGIWVLDAAGCTTFANARMAEMLGCDVDDLLGRTILDFTQDVGRESVGQELAKSGQARSQKYDVQLRRADGSDLWTLISASPIRDANDTVTGTLAMVADITDQKRAAASLQASEARLWTVLDNAPLILFAVDGEGRSTMRAGRGLTGLATTHGFPSTEHAGQSPYEVYDEHPQMQANIRRALTGESFSSMVEIDGHAFECAFGPIRNPAGKLDGAIGVATDVTERDQARQNLHRLQDEHEIILQSAGEGIYGQDCAGITTFVNLAAARMLGWAVEELIGRDMHTTLHGMRADGSQYPREACPIHAAVADGGVHHATGELFWRQNGSSFPVEYTSAPMHDGRRLIGAVVTFKDISERRAAEGERARLYQKLLERDKELHEAVGAILLARTTCPVPPGERDQLARLTARERDVLERLAKGQTNAEIAQGLGVGAGTVKSHVEHLLKKLGLVSRTQAAVWADRLGGSAFSTDKANTPSA